MNISSTAGSGQSTQDRATYTLEDWQDLKELFTNAVDMYESQEPAETIPFLRGVIHECHRFMKAYQDPSVLFATTIQPEKSLKYPSSEERFVSDWLSERLPLYPPPSTIPPKDQSRQTSPATVIEPAKKCKCKDLPTAFHTIFGTTLFLFGNLIAQDYSLALRGEPSTPTPYWLSAIDAFHIGESLPVRISGRGCPSAPEDWRMAVMWGRTLVNLADEILTRREAPATTPVPTPIFHQPTFDPRYAFTSVFLPPKNSVDEPKWPPDSPFALLAARRPPSSFRMNLSVFTPHELLQLAQDQFYRGIFHMPHQRGPKPQRAQTSNASKRSASSAESQPSFADPPPNPLSLSLAGNTFSRAKELYTIGSEVLLLAEKLDAPSERCHWARWADGVFSQMRMESNSSEDAWKVPLTIARGRSNLVLGSALAEEMDDELERGEMEVLEQPEAEDARDALKKSITFLEKAMDLISSDTADSPIPAPAAKSIHTADTNLSKTSMIDMSAEIEVDEEIIFDDSASIIMSSDDALNDETPEQAEIRTLLAEALLTLANLTADEVEREALYARARNEGKGSFELDDDRMDEEG